MTTKNAILLIIKQSPGIEYTALLNKVSADYATVNSARAAISRSLKDLSALGQIERKGSQLFVTDKASSMISSEMENKLLLRLNQLFKSKASYQSADLIVEHLHTLIEWSKKDSDLLKIARNSAVFGINDLSELNEKIRHRVKHLDYISSVLGGQMNSLREMDFNDSVSMPFDEKTTAFVKGLSKRLSLNEFFFESPDAQLLEQASALLESKPKGTHFSLPISLIEKTLSIIQEKAKSPEPFTASLFLSPIKIEFTASSVLFTAPASKINELER
ncbi:MAG: hypothetical protein V1494_07115 [Candidatus Diapherotrites archaeon]